MVVAVVALILGLPPLDGPIEHGALVGVAAACTVVLAVATYRLRAARPVWARIALAAALLTVHHALFLVGERPGASLEPAMRVADLVAVASCLLSMGWAAVLMARPLLSSAPTRNAARRGLPLVMVGAATVPLADARLYPPGSVLRVLVPAVPAVVAVAAIAWFAVAARGMLERGRTIEVRLGLAYASLLVLHVVAVIAGFDRYWAVPGVVSAVLLAGSSLHPSARLAGCPVDARPVVTKVPYRWGLLAASPLTAIVPAIPFGLGAEVAIGAVVTSLAAYAVFFHRLGGGSGLRGLRPSARIAAIGNALPAALVDRSIVLHYQPIVRAEGGTVVGLEGLLRWGSASFGPVGPNEVVDAARWSGLLEELEAYVVEVAAVDAAAVAAHAALTGVVAPYVAVNLSPATLQHSGFAERLLSRLDAHGRSVRGLVVEIVEQGMIEDWPTLRSNIELLRGAGARIALDDFGTGTSNLAYFTQISVDIVKLDRSLVVWAADGPGRAAVRRLVELTAAGGLSVIAEGVETPGMLACMDGLGVALVQGYLFARPKPLAVVLAEGPAYAVG